MRYLGYFVPHLSEVGVYLFQLLVSECCGNGTSISRGKKNQKIHCCHCDKVFYDNTDTFYFDLHKEEYIFDLAMKIAMKGTNEEASVDLLRTEKP